MAASFRQRGTTDVSSFSAPHVGYTLRRAACRRTAVFRRHVVVCNDLVAGCFRHCFAGIHGNSQRLAVSLRVCLGDGVDVLLRGSVPSSQPGNPSPGHAHRLRLRRGRIHHLSGHQVCRLRRLCQPSGGLLAGVPAGRYGGLSRCGMDGASRGGHPSCADCRQRCRGPAGLLRPSLCRSVDRLRSGRILPVGC